MTRVAHYLERWLELSAGFVAFQIAASGYERLVISRDGWLNLDAFPVQPRRSLHHVRDPAPQALKATVLRAQLSAWLTAYRCGIVHVHFGYAVKDVLPHIGRRSFVLSLHGNDVTAGDPATRYRRVADRVNALIVPSKFLADRAVAAGFTADRIHVIPSGVDTSYFTPTTPPDGSPVVAFVGRLVEKKGVDVLLEAWRQIRTAQPDARLRLLGSGPQAALVPRDDPSIELSAPDPARRREQVKDLLTSSTVVVTPSRTAADGDSESLLLVNLEAAACGRPVVSTRHGGIPEYVADGRTGLLVEENDPSSVATAVTSLLQDPDLSRRLGEAGPAHAAQWDATACAAKVDELYDELLASPSPPRV